MSTVACAVILEQRATGDARDLEVRHFASVDGVTRDHQPTCRLHVFSGRRMGHTRCIGDRSDCDISGDGRSTQAAMDIAGRRLHGKLAGRKRVQRQRKLQSRIGLSGRDEVAIIDGGCCQLPPVRPAEARNRGSLRSFGPSCRSAFG